VTDRGGRRDVAGQLVGAAADALEAQVAGNPAATPAVRVSEVNWDAAAATLPDRGSEPPAEAFTRLNAITDKRFTGIATSTVPVLLPFDIEVFRKDLANGEPDATTSGKYFGGFHPTKFFQPGPAGYDATFTLTNKEDGLKLRFEQPILFEISGAAFLFDLAPPNHVEL
jgi:hypothetical protein